jgi:putative protease
MKRKIELLAPGGDIDSIKAAIAAGADAIYLGLNNFNARYRATNIELKDLNGVLSLAHRHGCRVYLTINIIIVESEIKSLINLLNKLVNTTIDGIIVQDLGLFYILSKYFKNIEIHASTQLTTHNAGQINFLHKLNTSQVNISRELSLKEIAALTPIAHQHKIKTEVFVHGSYCISFSGICYMSSVMEGKSGNRGRCSQPCRDRYHTTPAGKDFPLNLKDNSAYFDLDEILTAGVDSIKIEGRIKKFSYGYTVVKAFRDQLNNLYDNNKQYTAYGDLHKVFNRDFSNGFLNGAIGKEMYIDNPRDDSARHFSKNCDSADGADSKLSNEELHALRSEIVIRVEQNIKGLTIEKSPLTLTVSGEAGLPLSVRIETPDGSFSVSSATNLVAIDICSLDSNRPDNKSTVKPLDDAVLTKKFRSLNDLEYDLERIETTALQPGLFIASKEITKIKKSIRAKLTGTKDIAAPIELPRLKKAKGVAVKPKLSVLISSLKHLPACADSPADIFFQLPSCFSDDYDEFIDIFLHNRELTPWFPSILIGKDYAAAVDILQRSKPQLIVTNNIGIAHEADKIGIPWIAGPYLNIANSFSLLCLKENFNCCGAFISNELSRQQIQSIVPPADFKLYYSIYHPIPLLTSRQCLFHQIVGCDKETLDADCLRYCEKFAVITNLKNRTISVAKCRGDYHTIYTDSDFLNTDIVTDLPDTFSSLFVDLRGVQGEDEIELDRARIIANFVNLLAGDIGSKHELKQILSPTTDDQYVNGI